MLSNSYREIHYKMLPAIRASALSRTTKTMRTAVEKADAVVQARGGIQCQGLVDKLQCVKLLHQHACARGRKPCCASKNAAWGGHEPSAWRRASNVLKQQEALLVDSTVQQYWVKWMLIQRGCWISKLLVYIPA